MENIGLGYFTQSSEKSADGKIQYIFFPGSGNVTGALFLSVGISF
jgi:hypothetical protein